MQFSPPPSLEAPTPQEHFQKILIKRLLYSNYNNYTLKLILIYILAIISLLKVTSHDN